MLSFYPNLTFNLLSLLLEVYFLIINIQQLNYKTFSFKIKYDKNFILCLLIQHLVPNSNVVVN